jgi:hypothetical protein
MTIARRRLCIAMNAARGNGIKIFVFFVPFVDEMIFLNKGLFISPVRNNIVNHGRVGQG